MGTRSRIGIINDDATITHVYCHWDGYPKHHGPILLEAYDTEAKVRELLAMGSMSVLDRSIGVKHDFDGDRPEGTCTFHGRDRQDFCMPTLKQHVGEFLQEATDSDAEWLYLFYAGSWRYSHANLANRPRCWDFLINHKGQQ